MTWQRMAVTGLAIVLGSGAVLAATPLGRDLIFHLLPLRWTGETERLAAVLGIAPGAVVADIGAGDGALIVELSRLVGGRGRAFATERTPEQRQRIASRATSAGAAVTVIAAGEHETGLPDRCCDAITMRMVFHHVTDAAAFARDLRRSVRPGGRIAVVDFAPGALPHLADDHGVPPEAVIAPLSAAGFEVERRDDRWGGRTYLLVFRAP